MGFWQKLFGSSVSHAKASKTYKVPDNTLVYAVGDIHGRADLLLTLQKLLLADIEQRGAGKSIKVIFLGDYIDRGFHSKEVIENLLTMDLPEVELVFLAGNHEDMMVQFLDDPAEGQLWLGVGGLATLASYGVFVAEDSGVEDLMQASTELAARLPAEHLRFLKNLQVSHSAGEYYFVHAGARPGVPMAAQRREDSLGIRREFTKSDYDFGCCVVHGHSGVRTPEVHSNRIAIDTGAFATGVLTAAVLETSNVDFIST